MPIADASAMSELQVKNLSLLCSDIDQIWNSACQAYRLLISAGAK